MTTLLENPLPVLAVGAVFVTLAALAFFARRNLASLATLVAIVAVTLLLLVAERLVVTDREQVENAISELVVAIETNDRDAVVGLIDPRARQIRADAAELMQVVEVKDAGASRVQVEVDGDQATAEFRGLLSATSKRGGAPIGYFDDVRLDWVRRGDRWLIEDFIVFYKGKAINPASSARSQRPIPAR